MNEYIDYRKKGNGELQRGQWRAALWEEGEKVFMLIMDDDWEYDDNGSP